MASEDVIELGSSDDEPEPPKKKMKPLPNAMVHIPHKLPGVTIKPAKLNSTAQQKTFVGKAVTMTKVTNLPSSTHVNKNKYNSVPIQKIIGKPNLKGLAKSIPIQTRAINPLSLMKKFNNSQILINKIPSSAQWVKNPLKVQTPKSLNNLPPSITVTRSMPSTKGIAVASVSNIIKRKRQQMNQRNVPGELLTVELDDDETSASSTASPQWYLRPEEQTEEQSLEDKNNKEPQPTNLIEITIEDSPVKPAHNNQTHEIGTELAITIDDSPLKVVKEKSNNNTDSDEEIINKDNKVPPSKKKLEYSLETKVEKETVEIEIEPMVIDEPISKFNKVKSDSVSDEVEEVKDTPKIQSPETSTLKKDNQLSLQSQSTKEIEIEIHTVTEKGEFNPVYQNFIDLCFELENSDDMKKIVEKKIKAYYRQVPKEYTESEEFLDMISSKTLAMKSNPDKMYLYIKDIVDELNVQRKMTKSQNVNEENKSKELEKCEEINEHDSKRQRQIHKLEKTIKKLHRAIQKLEEQEVDFDDDDDSVYLLTESDDGSSTSKDIDRPIEKNRNILLQRYKERLVRVHAKFCQLTNTKMPSEPRIYIEARAGQPSGPAKRLEKWINKKVPIGTPLPFPDFHDVLQCVREANEEDNLRWSEADIMDEARSLFIRCGKKLQRRRQENEWRLAASRISLEKDPEEESEDLMKKLNENKVLAAKREVEVLNKFADRQKQLKLEAEEIGDKEADESPVESEEDEYNEEGTSLQNKEKRKERLKRLLQEKAKKTVSVDKENQPINPSDKSQCIVEMTLEGVKENSSCIQESEVEIKQIQDNKIKMVSVSKNEIPVNEEKEACSNKIEKINLSDDSNKVESDIDELHLLQKLHSENEVCTSTLESSDSDAFVITSETLESQSDIEKHFKPSSDVISIENSSYSESETNKDNNNFKENDTDCISVKETFDVDDNIESCNSIVSPKIRSSGNNHSIESIENILLASSEDEAAENIDVNPSNDKVFVNLKDDTISIGDTVIEGIDSQNLKRIENIERIELDAISIVEKGEQYEITGSSVESVSIFSTEENICDGEHNVKTCKDLKNNAKISTEKRSDAVEKPKELNNINSSVEIMHSTELKKLEKCETENNLEKVPCLQEKNEIILSRHNEESISSPNSLSKDIICSDSNEKDGLESKI